MVSPTPRGAPWSIRNRDSRDVWFWAGSPSPGDTVIEVGAECGTDTVVLSRMVGPTGRVIAIEAHPGTFEFLARAVELNKLDNVSLVNAAVADAPGVLTISDDGVDGILSNNVVTSADAGVTVKAVTLDELSEGLARVDMVRMNIEGAEKLAVRGMDQTARRASLVIIGCHDFRADRGDGEEFRSSTEVEAALESWGFDVQRRADDARPWVRDTLYGRRS
ncbi:FkbM family methyltransferase [Aeromicrobium panaciterrae]|uniref:FkbM family methyltransferase n=1 Tax=Aeromicrobium panaciterrae TaxID=363861 RepID=A0ABU1UL76_9ACTN|nr:FkbM family methyltransferase [Aeromicrobium panaciterrae]